jgi:hypothetical protein
MKRRAVAAMSSLIVVAGLHGFPATAATSTPKVALNPTPTNLTVPWAQADDSTDPGCTSTCTSSPPPGPGGSMAYDPASRQLVLFAVANGNSTWTWDGSSWRQVDDAGDAGCVSNCTSSPSGTTTAGMAYDPDSRTVVLFGGYSQNGTWVWNGTTWTQVADSGDAGCELTCTASPPPTAGAQMAYDPTTHQIVLFGGSDYRDNFNDTWALTFSSGTYTWTQVDDASDPGCTDTCTSSPPTRNVATLTYDPATSQMVLFGGENTAGQADGLSDTWLWNGSSWRQVDDHDGALAGCGVSYPTANTCPSSPDGRVGTAVAYDPSIGRLVVFGGMNRFGSPEYDDTWVWNGRAWQQVDDVSDPDCTSSCTGAPQARDALAIADDAATDQLVMFGGGNLNNTWVAPAVPSAPPAPIHLHTASRVDRVHVSWSMPLLAGPPILGYRVVAAPSGRSCTTTKVMQCTLVGLAAVLSYTVSVRAMNFIGTGPATTLRHLRG